MDERTYRWLGKWERPIYFGKHERRESAEDARAYIYSPMWNGNALTAPKVQPGWVGTVGSAGWGKSPQVRMWMDKPKKTVRERIKKLFRK